MIRDNHSAFAVAGITVREWFAGQALIGLLAFSPPGSDRQYDADVAAIIAFEMADAMLAESRKERAP